jgi:Fe-S oxidoreductase
VSVLRDEMTNLLPHDRDAARLKKQTHLFSEFLVAYARPEDLPRSNRKAVVHGHCHEKALFGMESEMELLRRLGVDARLLDTGCCGMAGSFGFEAGEKRRVSMAIGELDVLPKVRQTEAETLVVADGFSCREQIHGSTTRRALHVAEVARMAITTTARAAPITRRPGRAARLSPGRALAVVAVALAATALIAARVTKHRRESW